MVVAREGPVEAPAVVRAAGRAVVAMVVFMVGRVVVPVAGAVAAAVARVAACGVGATDTMVVAFLSITGAVTVASMPHRRVTAGLAMVAAFCWPLLQRGLSPM
ncbi:hypothetical protein AA0483_0294 [Acetobacter syzygii NRIC 0483]|nr:hypothetical protein AA0483_0294 [Acetobacter syzygii NRIC 0483]